MNIKEKFDVAKKTFLDKKKSFEDTRREKKLSEINRLKVLKSKQESDNKLNKELEDLRKDTGVKTFSQRASEVFDKVVKQSADKKAVSPSRIKIFDQKNNDNSETRIRL